MKTFVCSDHHFGHKNIIKYCNRPVKTTKQDQDRIVEIHNSVVSPDDRVIMVGDVFVSAEGRRKAPQIMEQLNGKKYLVRGNHDILTDQQYKDLGFLDVYKAIQVGKYFCCHYPDIPAIVEFCKANNLILVAGHTHKPFNFQDGLERINSAIDVNPAPQELL